jgi:hypothetical protein
LSSSRQRRGDWPATKKGDHGKIVFARRAVFNLLQGRGSYDGLATLWDYNLVATVIFAFQRGMHFSLSHSSTNDRTYEEQMRNILRPLIK